MKKYVFPVAGLLLMILLVACSPAGSLEQQTSFEASPKAGESFDVQSVGGWEITLTKSGGIMGMSRSVQVSSTGALTLTDLRSNKSTQSKLPAAELSALEKLVISAQFDRVTESSRCADCFFYDLSVTRAGQTDQIQLDDTNLSNSGLQPLVVFLVKFLQ